MSRLREFGPYRLEGPLSDTRLRGGRRERVRPRGKGAHRVYLASTRADPDKRVVLKLLDPALAPDVMTALSADVAEIARRNDPRLPLVEVVEGGEARHAVVMRYVKADSLAELIPTSRKPSPADAVEKAARIADVLDEAGLPHGRLSPSNVLVDQQSRMYVVGWDTARLRGAAPEPTADVRGLAGVLLAMLLGRLDVDDSAADDAAVPDDLRAVIRQARSGGAFADVSAFVRAARQAVEPDDDRETHEERNEHDHVDPAPDPPPHRPPPPPRARPRGSTAARRVVVALVLGLTATMILQPWPDGLSVTSTDVGSRPVALRASSTGSTVYVANFADGTVTESDGRSRPRTMAVPGHPTGLALDRARRQLYVSDPMANRVTVVDVPTGGVVRTVDVDGGPRGMAVGPSGLLYVAASTARHVAVVDPAAGTVTATIPLAGAPVDVLADGAEPVVRVVTQDPPAVLVLDTASRSVAAPVELDGALVPEHAVAGPGGVIYLSDPASSAITVVDTATGRTDRIRVAGSVRGLTLSADGTRLYAALHHPEGVAVVDVADGRPHPHPPVKIPGAPEAVALTADGRQLIVTLPRESRLVRLTLPGST